MESTTDTARELDLKSIVLELGGAEFTAESFPRLVRAVYGTPAGRDRLASLARNWASEIGAALSSKTAAGVLEGYARCLLGDLAGAVEAFTAHKRSEWAGLGLVRALTHQGRAQEARKAADDLLKKAPEMREARYAAASARSRVGDPEAAEEVLAQIEASEGDSSAFLAARGFQRERQGEYSEAIDFFRKAIELDDSNLDAHFRLGFLLELYGNEADEEQDSAVCHYERCLEAVPVHTNAVINLGLLYEDRERYHDAIKCFEAVLRYYPNHHRAKLYLNDAIACTAMFYDKEQEKKADRHSQVLKIPVSDFELSVRSRNCLQKMNIDTLGDLIMKSEQELLSYKNFGETSLQEIKDMLVQKGLRLGQGLEDLGSDSASGRNPLEASMPPELLDRPIDDLNLSVRSRRCMDRLNVHTVRELINKTEVELMSAKNFGMTSLNEIKIGLKEFGLSLRS